MSSLTVGRLPSIALLLCLPAGACKSCHEVEGTPAPVLGADNPLGPVEYVSQAALNDLAAHGDLFSAGPINVDAEVRALEEAEAEAADVIERYLLEHPEFTDRLTVEVTSPNARLLPDGNRAVVLPDGAEVILQGEGWERQSLAHAIEQLEDPAPNRVMLEDLMSIAPDPCRALAPSASEQVGMEAAELRAASGEVARCWDEWRAFSRPFGDDSGGDFEAEIRPPITTGTCDIPFTAIEGGGNDGEAWCNPSDPMTRGFSFYPSLSPVRHQGARGSCVAFGTASALEYVLRRSQGLDVDISEQSLYSLGKWDMQHQHFGDGLPTAGFISWLDTSDAHIQLEDTWGYNPSYCRYEDKERLFYLDSCVNYDNHCSESAHQMALLSTGPEADVKLYRPTNPGTDVEVTSAYTISLFDFVLVGSNGLSAINAAVDAGRGVVLAIRVTEDFQNAEATGFLPAKNDATLGYHAVQLVRIVEDANAPGGRWAVIKNSWGCTWGDGGYAYLSYDWFLSHVSYAVALGAKRVNNTGPDVEIIEPNRDVTATAGALGNGFTLTASAVDPEEGADCCEVTWSSSRDGVLGTGNPIDVVLWGVGERVITATTRDAYGFLAQDQVTITLENTAPVTEIVRPEWQPHGPDQWYGQRVPVGVDVQLSGSAVDQNILSGYVPCDRMEWVSTSQSGAVSTETGCSLLTTIDQPGWVHVQLIARDEQGAVGVDSRWIRGVPWGWSDPPYVQITSPSEPRSYVQPGEVLQLVAEAASGSGGAPAIRWTLDDGADVVELGTGRALLWTPSQDAQGHRAYGGTLRAEVTDTNGTTADEVEVVVLYPPP